LGCPQQCMDLYPLESKGGGGAISCVFYSSPVFPVRNTDLDLMLECGVLAQRYGVDILSAMMIISWLMDLYQNGIITAKDTDGIPMEWGSREAMVGMLKKIAYREGFGNVLADGMLPAADKIGRGAKDYAYQVHGLPPDGSLTPNRTIPLKGLSLAMVMARGDQMSGTIMHEYTQMFKWLKLNFDENTAAEKRLPFYKDTRR
ncbi:aldehyde ferredoxin oxidoreductase C-terminal domain-containing protein, partial [Chloroflexota bacterium]